MRRFITRVLRRLDLAYHELALRQIDPLHPEVPTIIQRMNWIRSKL